MHYVLSIGTNLGNKPDNIQKALMFLKEKGISVDILSSIYETAPVDYTNQENFYNLAAVASCKFMPDEVLQIIRLTELYLKRERNIPKGPRTIDIDIIFWSEGEYSSRDITIPHIEFDKRLFVMVPVYEVLRERSFFWRERLYIKEKIIEIKDKFPSQSILCLGKLSEVS